MKKSFLICCVFFVTLCTNVAAHDDGGYLPLGDGHISTSPKVGYIYSCQTHFSQNAGGAFKSGDWISGDKWNPNAKPKVQGNVTWPNHFFTISTEGNKRIVTSNDLPDHPTGIFPIGYSDPAYSFDQNPNSIIKQSIALTMDLNPKLAEKPSCLPMGMIGIALTGIAIFNGLDGMGRDAAAHEIQDSCNGHPEKNGTYHYHNLSPCMKDKSGKQGKHSDLVGYASDGFGIYGQFGENGKSLTNKDLDVCHGHTHLISWNGVPQEIYHYHVTKEYPYTLSCFRGNVSQKMKSAMPAKEDGPWSPNGGSGDSGGREEDRKIMEKVAQELNINFEDLRQAMGPPPPDFAGAAKKLGISEQKLHEAFRKAHN